ncbi:MAG: oxidoreductase [Actinomycetota bacterium]|nr:oxidoreductase [Actinomycetota bacterium]
MESTLLALAVLIPWVLAAALALADGRRSLVGWFAAAGLAMGFACVLGLTFVVLRDGPVEMVAGGWPEGVGITLRADALGVTFAAVSVGVILVSFVYEVLVGIRSRTFPALVAFMAAGLSGLFLTGDAFNFYVFFEISVTSAYVLTGYREKDHQVRAAFIFAVINLLGSVIFLIGVAALYHVTGTLDMEIMAERVGRVRPSSIISIAVAVFVAFSLKLGLFPFHFWLPAVYVGSHPPVAAILSGALANIGGYGLLRFGADILPRELELGTAAVLILGTASIVYGALQAISRRSTVEVLAYSAIGQAGYILVALGIGGTVGYTAAVVYAVVNSLNKALLFLAAGMRGPLVGAAFAVGAFSVVGVPPVAGFVGKLAMFRASVEAGSVALTAVIFFGGALSFVYVFQVYQRVFWTPDQKGAKASPLPLRLLVTLLAGLILAAGLWPEPLLVFGEAAAGVLEAP